MSGWRRPADCGGLREGCGCRMAGSLGLERHIVLGKCFVGGVVPADGNVAAELFEAVLGAVYVDGGYKAARKVVHKSLPASGGLGD